MSKVCDKCHREYSGFGNTCGKCRRFLRTQGSARECRQCGSFSVGFSEECEECQNGRASTRPSTKAYANGRYSDFQYPHRRDPNTDLLTLHSRMKIAAHRAFGPDWMKVFKQVDKDHSGLITWEEFRSFCRVSLHLVDDEANLMQFFRQFDKDGSGSISIDELISFVDDPVTRMRALLKAATYQQAGDEWANYLRSPELSNDGKFSWDDFCQLCRSRLNINEEDLQLSICFKAIAGDDDRAEVDVEDIIAFVGTTVGSLHEPLQVTIIGCRGLESKGFMGMVETFATVEVSGKHVGQKKVRTPLLNMTGKVTWNHTGYIGNYIDQEYLLASVWIKRGLRKDDLMGRAKIVVADVYPKGFQGEVQLHEGDTAYRHGEALPIFLNLHIKKAVHGAQVASPHPRDHCMPDPEGGQLSPLKHAATNGNVGSHLSHLERTATDAGGGNLSGQSKVNGSTRSEGPRLKFVDDRRSGTTASLSSHASGRGVEDGQIVELRQGQEAAEREIAELKRTVEALKRTIAEKDAQVAAKEKENAKLRHDLAEVQSRPENLKVGAYRMNASKGAPKPGDVAAKDKEIRDLKEELEAFRRIDHAASQQAGDNPDAYVLARNEALVQTANDRSAEVAAKDEEIERLRHDLDDVLVKYNAVVADPPRARSATQDIKLPLAHDDVPLDPNDALAISLRTKSSEIAAKDKQIEYLTQELEVYKHCSDLSAGPDANGRSKTPGAGGDSPGHSSAQTSEALLKSIGEKNAEIFNMDKELTELHQDLAVMRIRYDALEVDASRLTTSKDKEIEQLKEALGGSHASCRATAGRARSDVSFASHY